MMPQERPPAARKAPRPVRRRVFRYFADRTKRRRMLLVAVTLVALRPARGGQRNHRLLRVRARSRRASRSGWRSSRSSRPLSWLGERRVARALEARFSRNTQKHREALAALVDEIAVITDRGQLEQRLVARFDELFGTAGTVLFVGGAGRPFSAVAGAHAASAIDRRRRPDGRRSSFIRTCPLLRPRSARPSMRRSSGRCASADSSSACWPAASTITSRASTPSRSKASPRSPMPPPPTSHCSILPSLRRGRRPTTCRRSWRRSSAASASSRSAGNCCRNRACSRSPDLAARARRGSRSGSPMTCSTGTPEAFGGWTLPR